MLWDCPWGTWTCPWICPWGTYSRWKKPSSSCGGHFFPLARQVITRRTVHASAPAPISHETRPLTPLDPPALLTPWACGGHCFPTHHLLHWLCLDSSTFPIAPPLLPREAALTHRPHHHNSAQTGLQSSNDPALTFQVTCDIPSFCLLLDALWVFFPTFRLVHDSQPSPLR